MYEEMMRGLGLEEIKNLFKFIDLVIGRNRFIFRFLGF